MGRAQGRWKARQGFATSLRRLEERFCLHKLIALESGFFERSLRGEC